MTNKGIYIIYGCGKRLRWMFWVKVEREGAGGVVGSIGSRFNMRIEGVGFYH